MARERNKRPSVARAENEFLDRALKGVVVCDDQPIFARCRVNERLWNRLSQRPNLDRTVVNGVTDANNFGGSIGGITVRARSSDLRGRACFVIAKKDRHGAPKYSWA